MTVPPEEPLRQKLQEVLARPEFQHGPETSADPGILKWLETLLQWLLWPMKWIYSLTEGLPEFLRWLIFTCLVLVLALVTAHLGWTLYRAMRGGQRFARSDRLTAAADRSRVTVLELESAAERSAEAGAFIEAIRFLFRAMLMRLEDLEGRRFRRGVTNRQHLRRYSASPIAASLKTLVHTIDQKWYGDDVCVRSDFEACQSAYSEIRVSLQRGLSTDSRHPC